MKKILAALIPLSLILALNSDFYRIREYAKHGLSPVNHFQKSIIQDKNEVVLGFWDIPDRLLVARKFKSGYFLVQRDLAATYMVPRGINLLKDPRTVIQNKSFKLSEIKSANSDLGGLYPPSNFPSGEMPALGYRQNSQGEWIKEGTVTESTVPAGVSGAIKYELPRGNNTTNWEQFPDLKVPEGITHVGGYGFPLYKNEKLQNGKLNLLAKGFTNLVNLNALPRRVWDGKNSYYFNQLHYLLKVAARNMVKEGKTGSKYGKIAAIAALENDNTRIPYYDITVEGAKELGRHIYYTSCCGNSIDDARYNIPQNESVIMLDEESMAPYDWPGGDSYAFLGYLNQGMMEAAGPRYRIFWYAQPVQKWSFAHALRGVSHLTEKDIEGAFNDRNILMNSPGWKSSAWYVDASGAYSKVPYLSHTDIYEKANGKITTDRTGQRKYRNENFNLKVYNRTTPVLATPDENIRYALQNSKTGEQLFGRQYVDISADGSAAIKREYARKGFSWHENGLARPYPRYWEPETKMWVEGIYRRADGIMADLLMLARLEKGRWDISKANVKYRLYGEHRPQTEPWTFGGNSVEVREVGEGQIFYDTFMLLLSGGQALSSWDDGFFRNELPEKGQPLYDKDDYWGRYHSKLAAVQTVLKPLEGSRSTDWTYVHFYYPFWGQKNSEVISSGIYFKGKLYVFFLNPTLENKETQEMTLTAGNKTHRITLTGHEVYYKALDVPNGLSPLDFKLDYTTIYGRKVKVNGRVTNKIAEHYE